MKSATSVKDRLKKQAASSGKTFQETLTAYGLERTVYRLSVSEFAERFTLKGGIFLYALFEGRFATALYQMKDKMLLKVGFSDYL